MAVLRRWLRLPASTSIGDAGGSRGLELPAPTQHSMIGHVRGNELGAGSVCRRAKCRAGCSLPFCASNPALPAVCESTSQSEALAFVFKHVCPTAAKQCPCVSAALQEGRGRFRRQQRRPIRRRRCCRRAAPALSHQDGPGGKRQQWAVQPGVGQGQRGERQRGH